jgi:hypothetical protein
MEPTPIGAPSGADGRILCPIRIGATGHRTIEDPDAIGRQVDATLDEILARVPPSRRDLICLIAVSSLAEGADRIIADRVLARPGGQLEVVLPLDPFQYEGDFRTAVSGREFRELLQKSSMTATVAPAATLTREREHAYLDAGTAVADRADVVIAVWDGLEARGTGGTAEIVEYVRGKGRPLVHIDASGGGHSIENLLGAPQAVTPSGWSEADLDDLAQFNRERVTRHAFDAALSDTRAALVGPGAAWPLRLEPLLAWVAPPLARADHLASRYQRAFLRRSRLAFGLAALAVTIVAVQIVWGLNRMVVWGEVAALALGLVAVHLGRRLHVHERWITYRYLGERLRNAFYLALAGADGPSRPASDATAADPGTPWVRLAFDAIVAGRPPAVVPADDVEVLKEFLRTAWVHPQYEYFRRRQRRDERRSRITTRVIYALFGMALTFAVLHALIDIEPKFLHHAVSLLSIVIPAIGAAVAGYAAQREYQRHAQRFERMVRVLAVAETKLGQASTLDDVRVLTSDIDRLLRQERGDWFGVVSLQDLELAT